MLLATLLGLLAGPLVALVARELPARGRLIGRPICARQGCGLDWSAVSSTARLLGFRTACPVCGAGPARSDVLLEVATVVLFALLAARWTYGPTLAVHLAFAALLLAIFVIDLRHREVYLVMGYGGIVLAVALAPLGLSGGLLSALAGGVVGALVFGAFYLLGRVLYAGRAPLGTGDVTIAALLGAMVGLPNVLAALGVGILAGGVGALLVLARAGSRKAFMPYGPALCLGGLFVLLR
jgi:leader peptidase (prepilin peptidase) / N-methyltransferase